MDVGEFRASVVGLFRYSVMWVRGGDLRMKLM